MSIAKVFSSCERVSFIFPPQIGIVENIDHQIYSFGLIPSHCSIQTRTKSENENVSLKMKRSWRYRRWEKLFSALANRVGWKTSIFFNEPIWSASFKLYKLYILQTLYFILYCCGEHCWRNCSWLFFMFKVSIWKRMWSFCSFCHIYLCFAENRANGYQTISSHQRTY